MKCSNWTLRAGFALVALLAPACAVTTFEGPGEPPRVIVRPYEPAAPAPPSEPSDEPSRPSTSAEPAEEQAELSHLLVQFRGARGAPPDQQRTREQARARAQQALERARAGEDFAALAREYSDEPGAAESGGYLGKVPRAALVPEFAEPAFALEPGGISEIIESPFGFHVILRHPRQDTPAPRVETTY